MKLTKKQIDLIIKNTPDFLKGTFPKVGDELGYYQKPNANWAYHAVWTEDLNMLVVTVYGQVR